MLMGTEFQFGKVKSSRDGWWCLRNNINALDATELFIENWLKMVNFLLCIFQHTQKKRQIWKEGLFSFFSHLEEMSIQF